ncbi:hypothetical protein Aduo_008632 [Ancylostoma duodenale]
MPPLPSDRVAITKPFQNVGCDFLGPFESKSNKKMCVCLYTCLTTRAVHLEVVENMSTGAFLRYELSSHTIRVKKRSTFNNTIRLWHKFQTRSKNN